MAKLRTPEQKARWAAYMRQYRATHRERVREIQRQSRLRWALRMAEQAQAATAADGGDGGRN